MPKHRLWTPTEDAIIRENASLGPSWEGYRLLLPGRTEAAIMARRKKLGVAFDRPGAQKKKRTVRRGPKGEVRPKGELPPGDGSWTDEQHERLVLGFKTMTERCDHTAAECVVEFARIVAAYRSGNLRVKEEK